MADSKQSLIEFVVSEIDSNTSVSDVSLSEWFNPVKARIQEWQDSNSEASMPCEIGWETSMLDLMAVERRYRSSSEARFRPLIEIPDRDSEPPTVRVYPDAQGLMRNEEAIVYYQKRVQETSNPIRRARYADFLWIALTQAGNREAYKYGIMAAEAYLEQVPLCVGQNAPIRLVEALDRAAELTVQLNNKPLANQVVDSIMTALSQLPEAERSRWVLEMAASLDLVSTKFRDLVTTDIHRRIREICDAGVAYLETQGFSQWSHLIRDLLALASKSCALLGDNDTAWEYMVKACETWEQEARQRGNSEHEANGGKSFAYKDVEEALRCYQRLVSMAPSVEAKQRMETKVEQAKCEVRRLIRLAEDSMAHFETSVSIPGDVMEQLMAPLLQVDPRDVFELMSCLPILLLDLAEIHEGADQAAQKYPLQGLITGVSLRDGRKIDEIAPGSGETSYFRNHLKNWFHVHEGLLDFFFFRLRRENLFTERSLLAHIERWEFFDERDRPFLVVGLERYFAGDDVSALHVLTSRVEHMLKSAFEQIGLPSVTIPNQRQIREQTFGDFLRSAEVRERLGENMSRYLEFALVDENGLNLRNDVAHGWITSPSCSPSMVHIVLFAILQITRLRRAKAEGASASSEPAATRHAEDEGSEVEGEDNDNR